MSHEVLIFELADGTREQVWHGSPRYLELIGDGHTPMGSVPESDGISDQLEAFLEARWVRRFNSQADKRARALRHFHKKLAAGGRVSVLAGPSDSITVGLGATSISKRWTSVLRDTLRTDHGYPAGGMGYVDLWNQAAFPDHPVTAVAPVVNTDFGLGRRSLTMANGVSYFTATLPVCTGFDIVYTGTHNGATGLMQYSVDGGAVQVVNTGDDANTSGGHIHAVSGLSATTHTLLLAWQSGPGVIVEGLMLYNGDKTTGVHMWEGGRSGFRAADYVGANTFWAQSVQAAADPDLVILPIGSNDFATGRTVTQTKADLEAILATLDTVITHDFSVVLVPYYDRATSGSGAWSDFVAMYHDVADANDHVCVCDLGPAFGPWLGDDRGGLTDPVDKVHPTDFGHRQIGKALAGFLNPASALQ